MTARPQPGNPKPRMFRFPADRALINRMGFNNQGGGAGVSAAPLRARPRNAMPVVGVNIGKTKVVPEAEAVGDYVTSDRAARDVADYLVVNVSSPNTPGLRNLQAVDHLRPLLTAVRETLDATATAHVPLLVKIAPDLADADVDAVADLALELNLDGIIATNTTIGRAACGPTPPRWSPSAPVDFRRAAQGAVAGGAGATVRTYRRPDHAGRRRRHRDRRGRVAADPGRGEPGAGLLGLHLRGPRLAGAGAARPGGQNPGRSAGLGAAAVRRFRLALGSFRPDHRCYVPVKGGCEVLT